MSDTEPDYPPTLEQPVPRRTSTTISVLGPVTAMLAILAIVLVSALALRERYQADRSLDNLRERATAAEAARDEHADTIQCVQEHGAEALAAISSALRADSELVIETAEQFDLLLRGQPTGADALRAQIENVRAAWGVVDRLNVRYAEVIFDCE